ncbi:hypothetical protein [Chitinophaga solisilvae]|uniref:Uncharacterized protein n=1 Tax=Chitinophaga solisilvae TaxID=1233460 RepID=A0A9Q5GP93_9BACT|nr:hypothetical protein [Chitinophaga solisilvae]NSL90710.1 hypothetical protein [Chitinophaga solisilvae]
MLESHREVFDYNGYYAGELARQVKYAALPQAAKVMQQLEALYVTSRDEMMNNAVIYLEFNEVIVSYYHELSTYQSVVLESLGKELKPALKISAEDTAVATFRVEYHASVRDVMKAFIRQSNRTTKFLQNCVHNDNDIHDICADRKMQELIAGIREMAMIQRKMVNMLQYWESQQLLNGLQMYYN